ncbi:MAG: Spy/CpxP family protein refolding chaperone [Ignavibacteriales bacterium]
MKRSLILFFLMVFVSSFSYGNDDDVQGKWWKHPNIAKELELTNDQQNRIEAIFSSYRPQMIELDSKLKEKEGKLRDTRRNPNSTREEISRLNDEVEGIRGNMRKVRVDMFLQIRDVLTPQQRTKLEEIKSKYGKTRH